MNKHNFELIDIRKILRAEYNKVFWTGKIYDEQTCDYKDLSMEDFRNRSMHSFLFIDKKSCLSERDIQISNSNFKIYDDSEFSQVEKDLSTTWVDMLNQKEHSL